MFIRFVLLVICCLVFVERNRFIQAADTVSVRTASGRNFRGEVDPRTNEQALWLRSGKSSAYVRRPITWSRVDRVYVGDKQHSADQFRRLIVSPEWRWAEDSVADEPDSDGKTPQSPTTTEELISAASWQPEQIVEEVPPKVVALHIDAYVANWDSDVEVDGLVVHAYPLDAFGNTILALGTLDVELIGEGFTNHVSGNPFPLLGRWSQVLQSDSVGTNGAIFRLPFQWVRPDFSSKWGVGSFGMVHARLSVGGSGVFEDTAAFTRIRPYSPVRDRMQQLRNTRFYPSELTSPLSW